MISTVCWECPRRKAGCASGCKDYNAERAANQERYRANLVEAERREAPKDLLMRGKNRMRKHKGTAGR